jgi:hypothetical protein
MFVETSEGLVNLALVRRIRETGGVVKFWFDGEDNIEIPVKEWYRIRGGMANVGLLLLE